MQNFGLKIIILKYKLFFSLLIILKKFKVNSKKIEFYTWLEILIKLVKIIGNNCF
ncbi:hypothetical protein GCM10010992_06710 [Cloacibacterium rupense]|uniref:Uncharacterized protein n=1 Tax=Cloacibacterium rupense TaxID=517423 RepID=A0ABQ2NHR3_9FLAO|nr:hypothetical protein GCM10010992_06710 [Cloacibacterium rupense]